MKPVTWKHILNQLKGDLIGKDSYRGVTLTYSWLANQFGHFSLGYIPTLIVCILLEKFTSITNPAFWAALIVSVLWLLFELYNFLGPLLSQKQSASKFFFIAGEKYTFPPAWGNVAFDTFTDLCFFWFGAFSAGYFLQPLWKIVLIIIVICIILLYPCFYWFLTKMYQQFAQYPFQFRLSQWNLFITEVDKQAVYEFLNNKTSGNHLFVFGGRRSGKTSLCVAMGNEMSIKHTAVSYTTGMKLYNMFFETDAKLLGEKEAPWTWRTSALLIIDDINPGSPVKEDLVTAADFLSMLDTYSSRNEENRRTFREKNVIWVLGKENNINNILSWKDMLYKLGINPDNITSINLLDSNLP